MKILGFMLSIASLLSAACTSSQDGNQTKKVESRDAAPLVFRTIEQSDRENYLAAAASIYSDLASAYEVPSGKKVCGEPCERLAWQERRAIRAGRPAFAHEIRSIAAKECWNFFQDYDSTLDAKYRERLGLFPADQHQAIYKLLQKSVDLLLPCRAKLCRANKDKVWRDADSKCRELGVVLKAAEKALKQTGACSARYGKSCYPQEIPGVDD
jgi:hypothetical protein